MALSGAMSRLAARHQSEHDDCKEGEAAPDGPGHGAIAALRLDPRIVFLTVSNGMDAPTRKRHQCAKVEVSSTT